MTKKSAVRELDPAMTLGRSATRRNDRKKFGHATGFKLSHYRSCDRSYLRDADALNCDGEASASQPDIPTLGANEEF